MVLEFGYLTLRNFADSTRSVIDKIFTNICEMSPSFWRLDVVSVTSHIFPCINFAQRNNFGLRSKQDLMSSHNKGTTTVSRFINSRIITAATGDSL